jgi:hypothetical protein
MHAMIAAYREDINDVEFKFIHLFAQSETRQVDGDADYSRQGQLHVLPRRDANAGL